MEKPAPPLRPPARWPRSPSPPPRRPHAQMLTAANSSGRARPRRSSAAPRAASPRSWRQQSSGIAVATSAFAAASPTPIRAARLRRLSPRSTSRPRPNGPTCSTASPCRFGQPARPSLEPGFARRPVGGHAGRFRQLASRQGRATPASRRSIAYVNARVAFVDDSRQYGVADRWSAGRRKRSRRGRGDCEDYAHRQDGDAAPRRLRRQGPLHGRAARISSAAPTMRCSSSAPTAGSWCSTMAPTA